MNTVFLTLSIALVRHFRTKWQARDYVLTPREFPELLEHLGILSRQVFDLIYELFSPLCLLSRIINFGNIRYVHPLDVLVFRGQATRRIVLTLLL